ncbi:MAG: hypothetical protein QOH51_2107 [Acidobacteriota bacterium]|jgi:hypothetical protein|nr:hypothetical protein [Acidobacteriota bacterium]
MEDVVVIIVRVLAIVLIGSIPVWLATRRARKKYRERFGRTPTDLELDSLGAWLKDPDPPTGPTPPVSPQSSPQPSPKTSFGEGPRT